MNIKKLTLKSTSFPEVLRHIDSPPQALYQLGAPLGQLLERPVVTIVGSRSASAYGQRVTEELAGQLAERGVVVVSGLALGIDGIAHRAALQAGGLAIAVLPGPVDNVVPRTNRRLSGKNARRTTGPRPRHKIASRLAEESQTLTVWSELAEARRLPIGAKATQVTFCVCP